MSEESIESELHAAAEHLVFIGEFEIADLVSRAAVDLETKDKAGKWDESMKRDYRAENESLAAQLEQERGKVAELIDRLRVEQRQFQSIRGYTKDGELACICANHESAIKELLATHTDNGGSNG